MLLDGAVTHARDHGAETVDAYPVLSRTGADVNPEAAFTGTWPMFEHAAFSIVADRASDRSASHPGVVVRLEL